MVAGWRRDRFQFQSDRPLRTVSEIRETRGRGAIGVLRPAGQIPERFFSRREIPAVRIQSRPEHEKRSLASTHDWRAEAAPIRADSIQRIPWPVLSGRALDR